MADNDTKKIGQNTQKKRIIGTRQLPQKACLDNGLKGDEHVSYIIEKVLGDGGFGIVYKAKARILSKNGNARSWASLAVKEFFPKECSRTETNSLVEKSEISFKQAKEGFRNEAEGLRRLEISNVVKVNECFECNDTIYYVMQFVEGKNLQEYVLGADDTEGRGALSEKEALAVMTPIIEAVEKLHENKMLHLDIKPNNIMLGIEGDDQDKCVKIDGITYAPILIDFGTAATANFIRKKVKVRYRSQGYSSPEQSYPEVFEYKEEFDRRLDVYALGATMYFLLTGEMPQDAPSQRVLFEEFIVNIRERLRTNGVTDSICDAIVKAMNPENKKRTSSAREFLNALGVGASLEAELDEKNKKRKRNIIICISLAILGGIVALFMNTTQSDSKRLQNAIDMKNQIVLRDFADADSLRAIKELVKIYETDSNLLMAWYWTEYVKERKDSIQGDKTDIDALIVRGENLRQNIISKTDTIDGDFKKIAQLLGVSPSELFNSLKESNHDKKH